MQQINAQIESLKSKLGHEVGVSPWITLDEATVAAHAATTGDNSWIHLDADRARNETPFDGPIVQGFLLLSLLTEMSRSVTLPLEEVVYQLGYGFDRVRMVQPVAVGSRVRGRFELRKLEQKGHHGLLAYLDACVDIEGDDIAPALVAEYIVYLRLGD